MPEKTTADLAALQTPAGRTGPLRWWPSSTPAFNKLWLQHVPSFAMHRLHSQVSQRDSGIISDKAVLSSLPQNTTQCFSPFLKHYKHPSPAYRASTSSLSHHTASLQYCGAVTNRQISYLPPTNLFKKESTYIRLQLNKSTVIKNKSMVH